MKGLSVTKFWDIQPKLPFRFKTHFYTGFGKIDNILNIALTNITLPKMEGKASEGSMYLGNTIFTMPTWSIGSRKLEITFEETDYMSVSQFIDLLNRYSWGKSHYRITIAIEEFDDKMRSSNSKGYVCHLGSYAEPQFKRDGQASQITMTATFIIDAIIDDWDESKAIYGSIKYNQNATFNQKALVEDNSKKNKKESIIPKWWKKYETVGRIYQGGLGYQNGFEYSGYKGVDRTVLKQNGRNNFNDIRPDPDQLRKNMRELGMSDKEIDRQVNWLLQGSYKETEIQLKNTIALSERLKPALTELKDRGIEINLFECWVTGEHATGEDVATHGMGAKVDISFKRADGTKITYNDATAQEMNNIQEVLNKNGLFMQFEGSLYNDPNKTAQTGWGDIALYEYLKTNGSTNVRSDNRKWGDSMLFKSKEKNYIGITYDSVQGLSKPASQPATPTRPAQQTSQPATPATPVQQTSLPATPTTQASQPANQNATPAPATSSPAQTASQPVTQPVPNLYEDPYLKNPFSKLQPLPQNAPKTLIIPPEFKQQSQPTSSPSNTPLSDQPLEVI